MPARVQQRISPFLWFDSQAEEAAGHYAAVFPNSRIGEVTRYDKSGAQASGQPEGSAMTVPFEIDGQAFTAINGGPHFKFTEAVSFVVSCADQDEIDHYWDRLSEGGEPKAQQCGWLKDKFGLSWQVVPAELPELMKHPGVMPAILGMKKIDLAALRAAAGK
jgi:predicted 3-demethylubiquinone-9 3-methyltransferase (glyoxalase superfamily)